MIIELRNTNALQEKTLRIDVENLTSRHREPLGQYIRFAFSTRKDIEQARKRFDGLPMPTSEVPSYCEIVFGLWDLFNGNLNSAWLKFSNAYAMYPKNHYALALLVAMEGKDSRFSKWARQRIHEISIWDGNENVFVIGDSFANCCYNGMARSRVFVFPHRTLHRFPIMAPMIGPELNNVPKHGAVVFCYGYVDVHVHVKKVTERLGTDSRSVMDTLVRNYMDAALAFTSHRPDINILISSIPPTSPHWPVPGHPHYGTPAERATLTRQLNVLLQDASTQAGFGFVDIHGIFSDPDGLMRTDILADDKIHTTTHHHSAVEAQVLSAMAMPARRHLLAEFSAGEISTHG